MKTTSSIRLIGVACLRIIIFLYIYRFNYILHFTVLIHVLNVSFNNILQLHYDDWYCFNLTKYYDVISTVSCERELNSTHVSVA